MMSEESNENAEKDAFDGENVTRDTGSRMSSQCKERLCQRRVHKEVSESTLQSSFDGSLKLLV